MIPRRLAFAMALLTTAAPLGCASKPPPSPPRTPPSAADWLYPGASESASIGGTEITANDAGGAGTPRVVDVTPSFHVSTTPDALETVYAFYAKKLGASPDHEPGKTASATTTPTTMTDSRQGVSPVHTGSIAHAGRPGREGVRTATLVKHDVSGDVVVVLSRGDAEALTTVEVILILRTAD